MKHILVNLKRFDIPAERGGVNRIAPADTWAGQIITDVQEALTRYAEHEFIFFFPELHLFSARASRAGDIPLIGCQGVYDHDTAPGGNFGAFTTQRTGNAMAAAGVQAALVGHSEERAALARTMRLAVSAPDDARVSLAVNEQINARAAAAQRAGLKTVVCVGETAAERDQWKESLTSQLEVSLRGLDRQNLIVAYEPIWAIGPGKTPPGKSQIQEVAAFINSLIGDVPLVYGGGLKADNAADIASIPELDGGLIALTRFTGQIGFYPDEYLEIVSTYFDALEEN